MFASGLPAQEEYTLWIWILGSEPEAQADAYINKDGLIVNVLADLARKIAEDPIDLIVFAGGDEPKRFALISTDGRYRVFGQVVPFRTEATAGPCHIYAITFPPTTRSWMFSLKDCNPEKSCKSTLSRLTEGD